MNDFKILAGVSYYNINSVIIVVKVRKGILSHIYGKLNIIKHRIRACIYDIKQNIYCLYRELCKIYTYGISFYCWSNRVHRLIRRNIAFREGAHNGNI